MHNAPAEDPDNRAPLTSLVVHPGTQAQDIELLGQYGHCIVLITNALGSLPWRLQETVRTLTAAGTPVFILPDNPGTHNGVVFITDALQRETQATGVIFLEKGNIKTEQAVYTAITAAVDAGLRGAELGETIRKQFAYGPNEQKPPTLSDQAHRRAEYKKMQIILGLSGENDGAQGEI